MRTVEPDQRYRWVSLPAVRTQLYAARPGLEMMGVEAAEGVIVQTLEQQVAEELRPQVHRMRLANRWLWLR